jgi:hypothetical protein
MRLPLLVSVVASASAIALGACNPDASTSSPPVYGPGGGGGGGGGGSGGDGGSASDGGTISSDGGGGGGNTDGSAGGNTDAGGGGGVPSTLTPGTSTISMNVAGKARTAVLYVPTNATTTSELVGMQTVPQVDWDAYNSAAGGNIDLPFLEQLRTQTQATGQVDAKKSFVFGYSQGGYMSFLYGMTDSTVLSCAGVLAASSPYGGGSGDPLIANAARKIPVALQIGTNDSAYGAAMTTQATLMSKGFPVQYNAINGAGHVPIPGDISVPLEYCRGQSL